MPGRSALFLAVGYTACAGCAPVVMVAAMFVGFAMECMMRKECDPVFCRVLSR